jgi:hypothetical protein
LDAKLFPCGDSRSRISAGYVKKTIKHLKFRMSLMTNSHAMLLMDL